MTNNHYDTHSPENSFVAKIIDWSVRNRILVLLGAVALLVAGILSVQKTPLDAIPDLSETQVIVRTDWAGQAPQVIEDQVTYPLASQMLGLPKTKDVRGFSMFGTSFVYIIFEDNTDMYWARSRVLESLSQIAPSLPDTAQPALGPDATGVGWVFQYALYDRTGQHDLQELRRLQDWFIRYELTTVDGVAEVASVGGFEKEYQVRVDPNKLRAFDIPLSRVIETVRAANGETGGRTLEMAETEYMIRTRGYIKSPADLEQAVIMADNGTPITLGNVARVVEGAAVRRGITELNGEGEAVGGIVVMRPGANALNVIEDVKQKLNTIRQGLPEGVELKTVYDRSTLIKESVHYLSRKLVEESLMVIVVTFLFLLHVRSALVAVITLPLGILAAFIIMSAQGITANIMSLGGIAIAIGSMVDAAIVMIENAHRKLSALPDNTPRQQKNETVVLAAKEVGSGLFFSLLIITVSFLPVFALTGQSEKLFSPLAYTKTYTMAAASLLSVTLIPVLMLWLLRGRIRPEGDNPITRFFIMLYKPVLNTALRFQKTTLCLALVALLATIVPLTKTGSEFMPPLYEGGILYMPMTLPGVTPAKMREILQTTNRQIMQIPEVEHSFGKAGRSDTATDPAPLPMIETWIALKPRDQWRKDMTPEKLMAEMNEKVRLPGMMNSWGYPIKIRIDMLTTGIRTPVGIKIAGDDLSVINDIARKVEHHARQVDGTRSAIAERVQGAKYIDITPDRTALARYGLSIDTVNKVIQTALGGMPLGTTVEGRERYALTLRYDRPYRDHIDDLGDIIISAPDGTPVLLSDVAGIKITDGPAMIKSENARLNGFVFVDIENRDLGSYITDLKTALHDINLPAGYTLTLSGQYEEMQRANDRLKIAIPATLFLILILLYLHFGAWNRTFLVMLSIPFGVTGGIWSLWLAGYNFSVATAVGFIALAGIAVETTIIMLLYIDQQMRLTPPTSYQQTLENIHIGAVQRLRPKLMTVGTIILGLIPIFLTDGAGSDVMRRIALPMVGGMASTFILTLVLIPVLYAVWMKQKQPV